jgi:hypothetical protein
MDIVRHHNQMYKFHREDPDIISIMNFRNIPEELILEMLMFLNPGLREVYLFVKHLNSTLSNNELYSLTDVYAKQPYDFATRYQLSIRLRDLQQLAALRTIIRASYVPESPESKCVSIRDAHNRLRYLATKGYIVDGMHYAIEPRVEQVNSLFEYLGYTNVLVAFMLAGFSHRARPIYTVLINANETAYIDFTRLESYRNKKGSKFGKIDW